MSFVAISSAYAQAPEMPRYIADAVASPLRSPEDLKRDLSQRPADLLAFSGVKPGDRIADFWPVPPYSTALLSAVAGPTGRVYAVIPAKLFQDAPEFEPKIRGALARFSNVTVLVQPFDNFIAPEELDVIWLGKIYHDFPNPSEMGPLDIAAVNRALFKALKPRGVLIIVDHAASAGSGFTDTEGDDAKRLHRIDPEILKAQVEAAGFKFVAESRILENLGDDHTKSVLDPSIRNRTDRFVFKFQRP